MISRTVSCDAGYAGTVSRCYLSSAQCDPKQAAMRCPIRGAVHGHDLPATQRCPQTSSVHVMPPAANETVKEKIKTDLGVDAGDHDFLGFKGLEQSVRDDVKLVKDSPMIDHALPVYGYIYDVRFASSPCHCHMRQPASTCSQQVFRVCRRKLVPSSLTAVRFNPHGLGSLAMPWIPCQASGLDTWRSLTLT